MLIEIEIGNYIPPIVKNIYIPILLLRSSNIKD